MIQPLNFNYANFNTRDSKYKLTNHTLHYESMMHENTHSLLIYWIFGIVHQILLLL